MVVYLGGPAVAGGKLKDTGTLWQAPNTGATNESGFSGLPGGRQDAPDDFHPKNILTMKVKWDTGGGLPEGILFWNMMILMHI